MKIREHYQSDSDVEQAEEWLKRRALDLDGDINAVTWKDRLVASVIASAVRPKVRKKKEK